MSDQPLGGLPYYNLVLTGSLGARLAQVGAAIARKLDAAFYNLESEVNLRENKPADELRKLYGEAYLRRVETDICREFALRRNSVQAVSAATLLDGENRARLLDSGRGLLFTCALDEALRRLYIAQGAAFQDPKVRASALHALKRDQELLHVDGLVQVDTTQLDIDQMADKAIRFWRNSGNRYGGQQ